MPEHDDSKDSNEVRPQESSKKSIKTVRMLQNTEEAIRYGERATYDDMLELMRVGLNQFIQMNLDLSTEVQLLREAYHAFSQDESYLDNYKKKQGGRKWK